MAIGRTARITALLASATGLSACTLYDGYGYGYDGGYYAEDGYPEECFDKDGYLYPECEDAAYVASHGYGYGSTFYNYRYGPYGWYDGFYYPGYSIYIYDRGGHRHRWSDNHRRHWEGRRQAWHGRDGDRRRWSGRRDRDGDGRGWRDRDGDGNVANRDQRRNGRRGDRPRHNGQAIAPDTNMRGVRGQMRGNRNAGSPGWQGGTQNSGRQAAAPTPAPTPSASPPPPPPPPVRTNRRQQESNSTRQTQRVRQNPTRNDPR